MEAPDELVEGLRLSLWAERDALRPRAGVIAASIAYDRQRCPARGSTRRH
jgi:hypothetical protein